MCNSHRKGTVKVLRAKDIGEIYRIPKSTLRRLVDAGDFPAPIRLGPRALGWHAAEVEEWLATRERVGKEDAR